MITLYDRNATSFDTVGLCVLTPLECTVSWQAGGKYELELIHPIDETNRWAMLQNGCIVCAPVPVRESPLYEYSIDESGTGSVTREIWEVSCKSLSFHDRFDLTDHYRLKRLKRHTRFVVLDTRPHPIGEDHEIWMNVTLCDTGETGWLRQFTDNNIWTRNTGETVTEHIEDGRPTSQKVISLVQSRNQPFRIYSVEQDTDAGVVTVQARHVFYDLAGNLYKGKYEAKNATGADVVAEITGHLANPDHPFKFYTEYLSGGEITHDFDYVNPIEAFLDPDDGVVANCKCQIIRDGFDVHFLDDQPNDMGVTVRRGKNLFGVTAETDSSDIVTRILPCGKDVDGNPMWLVDADTDDRYVISEREEEIGEIRIVKKDYDVKLVKKDEDNVTTFRNNAAGKAAARAKMRELAEKDFADGADMADYTLEVNFVLLQDAEGFEKYAALQSVHPYDTVTVIDSMIGLNAKVRVTAYEWNALTRQYEDVTLGDLVDVKTTTYSFNLPNGGISGTKISGGTLDGAALRSLSVQYGKFAVAAVDQLSADALTAHAAYISELTAQTIDTDEIAAAYARLFTIVAQQISAGTISAGTIAAAMATMTQASIGTAQIGYAQIMDATVAQLITHDAVADRYFAEKLMVRNLQVVEQTVGSLIVKASDGSYYRLDIDTATGTVSPTQVTVSAGEIAAGVTQDGTRSIIETDLTVADLSASSVKAINALIDRITAERINVDTLIARQAFIDALKTRQIVGDKSIEIIVQDVEDALETAAEAQQIASTKTTQYYQSDEPQTATIGDVWNKTDVSLVLRKVADGTITESSQTAASIPVVSGVYSVQPTMIGGKTIFMNQLIQNGDFAGADGWTMYDAALSVSDGIGTVSVGSSTGAGDLLMRQTTQTIVGHTYLMRFEYYNDSGYDGFMVRHRGSNPNIYLNRFDEWTTAAQVVTVTAANDIFILTNRDVNAANKSVQLRNVCVFDLSLMFGATAAATITTPEQAYALGCPRGYVPHSTGELYSADVISITSLNSDESQIGAYEIPADVRTQFPLRSVGDDFDSYEYDEDSGIWSYVQRIGSRAYQPGDDSDPTVLTDGTTTFYALAESVTTEISGMPRANVINAEPGGTVVFVQDDVSLPIPSILLLSPWEDITEDAQSIALSAQDDANAAQDAAETAQETANGASAQIAETQQVVQIKSDGLYLYPGTKSESGEITVDESGYHQRFTSASQRIQRSGSLRPDFATSPTVLILGNQAMFRTVDGGTGFRLATEDDYAALGV